MIKSMTGFGRASGSIPGCEITVEIRSVNHRYFDCNVRASRLYACLEEPVKRKIQGCVKRGKVDAFLTIDFSPGDGVKIEFNRSVAESYLLAAKQMEELFGIENDVTAAALARFPEVFSVTKSEVDAEALESAVLEAVSSALSELEKMRIREGEELRADILSRVDEIARLTARAEVRSPIACAEYRARLEGRMREVLESVSVEESRLLAEAALFADKTAVNEETVRLASHCGALREILSRGGAVGRKLDFLVQELHREANTIGSKGNDIEMSRIVVDLKSEIEKIREQVQNIE